MNTSTILWAAAAMAIGFLALGPQRPGEARAQWTEHSDPDFGFRFSYPRDFLEPVSSEDEAGQRWVGPDGNGRLVVGALENESRHSLQSYLEQRRAAYEDFDISYAENGASWFVLSGENDTRVFYEKVMFSCSGQVITGFSFVYPIENKNVYDPIVEHVEDTFTPGSAC